MGLWEFPDLQFKFAGGTESTILSLLPEEYIKLEKNICILQIAGLQDNYEYILGNVFMRKYYSIFDADTR